MSTHESGSNRPLKDRYNLFWFFHLPAIACGLLILTLSSIPDFAPPKIGLPGVDKIAHFLEYAGFAFLIGRSLPRTARFSHRWFSTGMLLVALFAALDENWQRLIPGRFPDLFDYLVDLLGGLTGLSLRVWLQRRWPDIV